MDNWLEVEKMIQNITAESQGTYIPEVEDTVDVLSIADYWKKRMHTERDMLRLKLKEREDTIVSLRERKNALEKHVQGLRNMLDRGQSATTDLEKENNKKNRTIETLETKLANMENAFRRIEKEMIKAENKRQKEEESFLRKIETMQEQQGNLIETIFLRDQTLVRLDNDKRKAMRQHTQDIKQLNRQMMIQKKKEIMHRQNLEILAQKFTRQLRDTLTVVSGNIQLASARFKMQDGLKSIIESIENNVEQFTLALDEFGILSVSPEIYRVPVNINDVVQRAMNLMNERARAMGIKYEFRGEEYLPEVMIDQELMMDCLINIVRNAFEATSTKGTIMLHTGLDREHGRIFIKIHDTGCGIPKDVIEQVWKPYFTTKKGHKGLGLTIAYRIVELHEGIITIQSTAKQETTVSIFLKFVV